LGKVSFRYLYASGAQKPIKKQNVRLQQAEDISLPLVRMFVCLTTQAAVVAAAVVAFCLDTDT